MHAAALPLLMLGPRAIIDVVALWQGFGYGLVLALSIGPVFFALMEAGLGRHGFRVGAALALGVMASDAVFIAIALVGADALLTNPWVKLGMSMAGGIFLLIYGIRLALKTSVTIASTTLEGEHARTLFGEMLRGFYLNALNPSVFLFWMGMVVTVHSMEGYTAADTRWFFAGILVAIVSTDISKVAIAGKLKHFLTARTLLILNRVSGVALVIFGAKLLFDVVRALWARM